MQFSVVIPTYNRAAELEQMLASLAKINHPGSWEVIVVDNNSRDATPQVVARAAVSFPTALRYLLEPKVGRSAALNTGINAAKGDIIANTDDDVRFEPDWLQQAAEALLRERCDFVGGKVLPIWPGPRPAWLAEKGGPRRGKLSHRLAISAGAESREKRGPEYGDQCRQRRHDCQH